MNPNKPAQEIIKRSPYAPAPEQVPVGWCSRCGRPLYKGEKHLTIQDAGAILWKEESQAHIILHFCNKAPTFCTDTMLEVYPTDGIEGSVEREKNSLVGDPLAIAQEGIGTANT